MVRLGGSALRPRLLQLSGRYFRCGGTLTPKHSSAFAGLRTVSCREHCLSVMTHTRRSRSQRTRLPSMRLGGYRTHSAYSLQADTTQAGRSDAPRYSTFPCLTTASSESMSSAMDVVWSHCQ